MSLSAPCRTKHMGRIRWDVDFVAVCMYANVYKLISNGGPCKIVGRNTQDFIGNLSKSHG